MNRNLDSKLIFYYDVSTLAMTSLWEMRALIDARGEQYSVATTMQRRLFTTANRKKAKPSVKVRARIICLDELARERMNTRTPHVIASHIPEKSDLPSLQFLLERSAYDCPQVVAAY